MDIPDSLTDVVAVDLFVEGNFKRIVRAIQVGMQQREAEQSAALGEGLPLEECYIKSTSRAQDLLYTYDAVNRLYDSQLQDPASREISNYIHFGPLERAIIRAQYGRRMELSKNSGLSELIDWVSYMQAVETPVKELEKLPLPYIGVLLKQQIDQQRARKSITTD